ncbi:MAG TPA: electron transport complex subunit RsxC, partial [Coriobacteriia bacterium]
MNTALPAHGRRERTRTGSGSRRFDGGEQLAVRLFRGGVHPPDRKAATASAPVARAPLPERIVLPMSQHLGAPCQPLVAKGDRVRRGQMVGSVDAMISAPVHSPVAGEVVDVALALTPGGLRAMSVTIAPDADQDYATFDAVDAPRDDVRATVRAAGIVGLGGAAFPSAVKLAPPKQFTIDTVILNGCECEPYLTCDHRLMLEKAEAVIAGAELIASAVGATRTVIAVEDNKPDAVDALRAQLNGAEVEVVPVRTRYPQGAEKQLIFAVTGRSVPRGQLPAAAGCLVHNVGTAVAVADAVERRMPLMERIVTVSGAVAHPGNYLTLIGTPMSVLVDAAGGLTDPDARLVAGGPMTGQALSTLDVPVVKGTSGIVAVPASDAAPCVDGDQPCIRCARCVDACPISLHPYQIASYADRGMWDG